MTAQDIIREVQENAAEWLEMTKDPAELVAVILANKVMKLESHIEYLEKRLAYVSKNEDSTRIYSRNA